MDRRGGQPISLDASGDSCPVSSGRERGGHEKTADLSDDDEDENILTFDDIEGEKLPTRRRNRERLFCVGCGYSPLKSPRSMRSR